MVADWHHAAVYLFHCDIMLTSSTSGRIAVIIVVALAVLVL